MTRISLHLVSLCLLLLLLTGRTAASRSLCAQNLRSLADRYPPEPHGPKCITEEQLHSRENRILKKYQVTDMSAQNSSRTCAQVLEEMRKGPPRYQEKSRRSLSPWEYSVDQDDERIPSQISVARCLCEGCIINLREDPSYNSVKVCAQMMVLRRKPCPNDAKKYVVKKELITVPVACTCVKPSYSL
ncbi:hypothetical protein ILYODFUR_019858 [Ilyodon furcidens]|uniref:Interleukin-17C n=1 Tax=Ilyodon furcidens TaxID=33524 RepID=A0ABV0UUU1_9TELE